MGQAAPFLSEPPYSYSSPSKGPDLKLLSSILEHMSIAAYDQIQRLDRGMPSKNTTRTGVSAGAVCPMETLHSDGLEIRR